MFNEGLLYEKKTRHILEICVFIVFMFIINYLTVHTKRTSTYVYWKWTTYLVGRVLIHYLFELIINCKNKLFELIRKKSK